MKKAFTLIELLIVVAIIAILAAIAVPNFLEAQTRAKVSRAKADMRSLATGLESYRVDNNTYPKCNNFGLPGARPSQGEVIGGEGLRQFWVLEHLSTPVAYLTNGYLPDPFETKFRTGAINPSDGSFSPNPPSTTLNDDKELAKNIKYVTPNPEGSTFADVQDPSEKAQWYYTVFSNGPDLTYPNIGGLMTSNVTVEAVANNVYDPTNGTVSTGNIFRLGGTTTGTVGVDNGAAFFDVVNQTGN